MPTTTMPAAAAHEGIRDVLVTHRVIRRGEVSVDLSYQRVYVGDKHVELSDRLARVLCRLAEADGEVVTRRDLMRDVWGDRGLSDNIIDMTVSDLREKLAPHPIRIKTLNGEGYRLLWKGEFKA